MQDQDSKKQDWFWKLFEAVLRSHAKNANLDYFRRKYPGSAEIVSIRRINIAAKWAGLVGFGSGVVYSVAGLTVLSSAVGTVATGLLGSPVTVPALAVSIPIMGLTFAGEVAFLIRIQLHLAYDLFMLYGLPINVDDPEQMQEIMQVAFGIKGAELTGQTLQKVIPQVAPKFLRKSMRTGLIRRRFQASVAKKISWKFARKYFGEGVLIKALVPVLSIITATWWNFASTKLIGKTLQSKIRQRGLAVHEVEKLTITQFDNPKLILKSALFMGLSSKGLSETQLTFYSHLVEKFRDYHGDELIDSLNEDLSLEWSDVEIDLVSVEDAQQQEAILKLLVAMVVVGGKLNHQNLRRLEKLSKSYGIRFNKDEIKLRCKKFEDNKPFHVLFFMMLILFLLLSIICVLTAFGVFRGT